MSTTTHRIFAVKFAQHRKGNRADFYHGAGAEPRNETVAIDYFVWVIRSPDQDIILDAGYTPSVASKRNRPDYFHRPSEALRLFGVDCATVPYVILSHLHYDHAGDLEPFTSAKFVLQDEELRFWTGRYIHRRELIRHIEVEDIVNIVRYSLSGRVLFVDGDRELVPGVSVHRVGGHTPGMQVVRVETANGPIVLASDASHLSANIETDAPTSVFTDLPGVYGGFDRMIDLAGGDLSRVIAGHDADLINRSPAVPGLEGIAAVVA